MKQVLTFLALFLMLSTARAQAPNAIPYQAAARNSSGAILATTNISVMFKYKSCDANDDGKSAIAGDPIEIRIGNHHSHFLRRNQM